MFVGTISGLGIKLKTENHHMLQVDLINRFGDSAENWKPPHAPGRLYKPVWGFS